MSNNIKYRWLNKGLYPFQHQFIQLRDGKMHYIDEGEGETLLFIHGTPTWSFLYRNYIKELSKNHRCIAIDHIGFGLSEKPVHLTGTPSDHAKNLGEFISKLDLHEITLVVHDFGGPIGLAAGIEHHDKIKRVVLFNSWLWATKEEKDAIKVDKILNSTLGKFLYLHMNFSPKVLLKKGFADRKKLSKEVHQHYIKPFPNKNSRMSLLNIGKALVGSSDWYQEQWQQLDELNDKEWLILWGFKDAFITPKYLRKWQERLPDAEIHEFDCGHFVQEEQASHSIELIRRFMNRNTLPVQ